MVGDWRLFRNLDIKIWPQTYLTVSEFTSTKRRETAGKVGQTANQNQHSDRQSKTNNLSGFQPKTFLHQAIFFCIAYFPFIFNSVPFAMECSSFPEILHSFSKYKPWCVKSNWYSSLICLNWKSKIWNRLMKMSIKVSKWTYENWKWKV